MQPMHVRTAAVGAALALAALAACEADPRLDERGDRYQSTYSHRRDGPTADAGRHDATYGTPADPQASQPPGPGADERPGIQWPDAVPDDAGSADLGRHGPGTAGGNVGAPAGMSREPLRESIDQPQ